MHGVSRRLSHARLPRLVAVLALVAAPAALALPVAAAASSSPQAAAVAPAGHTRCVTAQSSATTCTGTYGGDRAYSPKTGKMLPPTKPPTVTVSQTRNLVNQVVHLSWTNFTPSTSQSDGITPEPDNQPTTLYHVAIYECRGTNPTSPVGNGDSQTSKQCYDIWNVTQVNAVAGAANGVITYTRPDGSGEADFLVEAGPTNSFLHCGVHSPCSLVVVPNWGGSESLPPNVTKNCADHSNDAAILPGVLNITPGFGWNYYIGASCSWADRIVVPLSFAPQPSNCPARAPAFQSDGSPMLEPSMTQWQVGLCTGRRGLSFGYTSDNEYLARQFFLAGTGALTSRVDMALVTRPPAAVPPSARKFTYAPLANSGIAIAYYIDNPKTAKPITNLVLNARLVAKLLTQSYSLSYDCTLNPGPPQKPPPAPSSTCDPAVAHNPPTIFDDPEFLALNGGNTAANRANFPPDNSNWATPIGVFLPIVVSGNSDMTYELTRWVMSDPAARAFLAGQPEKWHGKVYMRVNSNYRHISYPADQFQPLDSGWTTVETGTVTNGRTQTMQASWNPVSGLDNVAGDLATFFPTTVSPVPTCILGGGSGCHGNTGYANKRLTGVVIGNRAMFAVVAQGQAAADRFPVAKLVNAAGRAVAPSATSMAATVSHMKANSDKITQYANFANRDPRAYPLTMVDYAMVPTCHLARSKVTAIATFLRYVVSHGQHPGVLPGDLPPGFLALDQAQRAKTLAAVRAVQAQSCPSAGHGGHGNGGGGNGGSSGSGSGKGSGNGSSRHGGGTGKTHTTSANGARNAAYSVKNPNSAGLMRIVLPVLLVVGGLLGIGGPAAYVLGRTGAGPVLRRQVGTAFGRLGRWARRS